MQNTSLNTITYLLIILCKSLTKASEEFWPAPHRFSLLFHHPCSFRSSIREVRRRTTVLISNIIMCINLKCHKFSLICTLTHKPHRIHISLSIIFLLSPHEKNPRQKPFCNLHSSRGVLSSPLPIGADLYDKATLYFATLFIYETWIPIPWYTRNTLILWWGIDFLYTG